MLPLDLENGSRRNSHGLSVGNHKVARVNNQSSLGLLLSFQSLLAPALGKLCSLVLPFANTAMMNLFLKHLSLEFAEYLIILQLDRAGWHRAKRLQIPENIRLLPQPAYSPQVMPVEHIWEEIL